MAYKRSLEKNKGKELPIVDPVREYIYHKSELEYDNKQFRNLKWHFHSMLFWNKEKQLLKTLTLKNT